MLSFTYISVALFLMRPTTENYKITHERKFWSHKKKFRGQEIPTGKYFGPTSYLKKKNLGPTKYPRENTWDPRNTHEKILWTHNIPTITGWYDATRLTRSAMARDSQNLAHSEAEWCFKFWFWYCVNHPRENGTF